jgi:arylsulfatase A-like enzyme
MCFWALRSPPLRPDCTQCRYIATTTPHAGFLNGNTQDNPSWYAPDNPVPYTYSQRFLNETGPGWNNVQTQFAAAVWAQDEIVGAVLDKLDALGTASETVVFFSGDNGPDGHPFELMDDMGIFRGKKRFAWRANSVLLAIVCNSTSFCYSRIGISGLLG